MNNAAAKATYRRLINLSLAPQHPAAPIAQRVLDIAATKAAKIAFAHFLELCGPNVRALLDTIEGCPDPGLPTC